MKKITRRSFLTVCGAVAAAAALTACGGSASSAAASSTSAAAGSTASSTAAALSGNVATGGSTSMKNVIAALTEGFAEVEPGVTVSYDPTGSGAGITGNFNFFIYIINFCSLFHFLCIYSEVKFPISPY